jgi:hypothetical protein
LILVLATQLVSAWLALGHISQAPHHYNITIELSPARRYLEATVLLDFRAAAATDSLVFFLHEQLAVDSVSAQGLSGFVVLDDGVPSYMPDANTVVLRFDGPLSKDRATRISFRYSGRITRHRNPANRLSEDWVELNLYSPFFPFNFDYGPFTYFVDVSLDESYTVVGMGRTLGAGKRWTIESDVPAIDIVVTASKDYTVEQRTRGVFGATIGFTNLPPEVAGIILEDGIWLLSAYAGWFGDVGQQHASIVVAPRAGGGGYSRKGFVVLAAFDEEDYTEERVATFKHVAHEFAHIWWSMAPVDSWEDWLNESFAEYTALMAVRETFGVAQFKELMAQKSAFAEGQPAIVGLERSSRGAYSVLYYKGPTLLHALEIRLGPKRFRRLLREMIARDVSTTDRFLGVLGELEGEAVRAKFAAKLSR